MGFDPDLVPVDELLDLTSRNKRVSINCSVGTEGRLFPRTVAAVHVSLDVRTQAKEVVYKRKYNPIQGSLDASRGTTLANARAYRLRQAFEARGATVTVSFARYG